MTESIACPGCGKRFAVKPSLLGRRVKCTSCGTPFNVPARRDEPNPLDELKDGGPYGVAGGSEVPPPPIPPRAPAATPTPTAAQRRAVSDRVVAWEDITFRTG